MAGIYRIDGSVVRKEEESTRNLHSVKKASTKRKSAVSFAGGVALLIMTAVAIVGFARFIKAQSDVTNLREDLARVNAQYEAKKLENDLYEKRIESNINLANIEQIAMTELGMTLAGAGQIEFYDSDMEDYVKQYENLPGN